MTNRKIRGKRKKANILMRNLLKDEKLLEKSTYTRVNFLRVFGFYISIFFSSCQLLAQTEF